MNFKMFEELKLVFEDIDQDFNCKCVLLRGHGPIFTSGFDSPDCGEKVFARAMGHSDCIGRRAYMFNKFIKAMQDGANAPEKCRVPVIVAIHGMCKNTAIDISCSCDIRLTSKDCMFALDEINGGIAADLGPLQRLPKICGNESLLRELILTGRDFSAAEARELGYVSHVYENNEELFSEAMKMATNIAKKSPVAILGVKNALVYSRDHTVEDSMNQIREWNSAMVQNKDIMHIIEATTKSEEPKFENL